MPWLGSERDGGYAQYVSAPSADTYQIKSDMTDAELAAVPCAYATAENLINRARLASGETVLITGASGNVGIAAIQLAKRRGCHVTTISAASKFSVLRSLGADRCLERNESIAKTLGNNSINVSVRSLPPCLGLADGIEGAF